MAADADASPPKRPKSPPQPTPRFTGPPDKWRLLDDFDEEQMDMLDAVKECLRTRVIGKLHDDDVQVL